MRVSAIGYAFDFLREVLKEVKQSCYYTHYHPEAIRNAQAVATAVFLARKGCDKSIVINQYSAHDSLPK